MEYAGRHFRRWLEEAGGVGSVGDVRRMPGVRMLPRLVVERCAREALAAQLVREYPGLPGEGAQYVVGP